MAKDVKNIDTPRLMVWAELLTKMTGEIYELGTNITTKFNMGVLSESVKEDLLQKLQTKMGVLEDKRIEVAKEITRRFKHDLGLKTGPWDLDKFIDHIWNEYPILQKTPQQINFEKAQEEMKKKEEDKSSLSPVAGDPTAKKE